MDAPMPPEVKTAWEKFAFFDDQRPAGLDIYPDIFKDGWLFPLQRMRETSKMISFARSIEPKIVMEIGTDKGGGFYHWLKCIPSITDAIAIEIRGCPFSEAFQKMFPNTRMKFIEASSYERTIVESVATFLEGRLIDVLFIDGEKGNIEKDFNAYRPYVRKGGLIMIHDIVDKHIEPSKFFYGLRSYEKDIIYDGTEGLEAAARAEEGKPITSSHEQWLRIWKDTSCGVGIIRC